MSKNITFTPKVSVIIPNYNHANYLNQRIDSILKQSFQDFEIILKKIGIQKILHDHNKKLNVRIHKKFNEYYYKNKKLGSDPAKYFEKKFYKKFNTNDNIENIIKINYSPIYKLSHKNKLTINNTIYLYKLL